MKFIIVILSAILVPAVYAETSINSKVLDKYLDENSSVFHDKPVLQTIVSGELPKGFDYTVFHSIGLNDSDPSSDFGDEIDIEVGKEIEFGLNKAYTARAAVAYWDVVDLFSVKPADVIVAQASLARSITEGVAGRISFERYFSTDSKVFDGGSRVSFLADATIGLGERLKLAFNPGVVWDEGAFGLKSAWIVKLEAGLRWKIGRFELSLPEALLTRPIKKVSDRNSEIAWGGGISFTF